MNHLTVIYHSPCMDGYGAACAVKAQLQADEWKNVTYLPMAYTYLKGCVSGGDVSRIPHMTTHLLFVDMCPDEEALDHLLALGFYITILDHHAGAKPTLSLDKYNSGNPALKYLIADDYSGASLIKALGDNINWAVSSECIPGEQVTTNDSPDGQLIANCDLLAYLDRCLSDDSYLYKLLEVRDIWIKTNPLLKEKADILASYFKKMDVAKQEVIGNLDEVYDFKTLKKIIEEGEIILSTEIAICEEAFKNADVTELLIDGKPLRLIVAACPNNLGSNFGELGNTSVEHSVITIALFYDYCKKEITVSLRSKGDFPCLPIAKLLGGGGHPNASGMALDGGYTMQEVCNTIYSAVNKVYPFMNK